MKRTVSGFTIVELLIVIVVISILAAITAVAFNGVQTKARDNQRYADAKAIMKALELYKTDKGFYPSWTEDSSWTTAVSSCGAGHQNGYSYSSATDGTWMRPLVTGGYLPKIPLPPNPNCSSSYYRYISTGDPTSYNCPSRTKKYYVIEIQGVEGMPAPSDASDPAGGGNWTPCVGATAGWGAGNNAWVFAREQD